MNYLLQHTDQRRRIYLGLLLIVITGIALRLWLITISPLDPRFSNADDGDYYRRALRLAVTGQYSDDSWLIRPPLHVFFFAFWLKLALLLGRPQDGVLLVQLAQVALGGLSILLGYGIASRFFKNWRAGLLFAAFLSFWFPYIEQTSVLFTELIYQFLFLLHMWLLLRFDSNGRLRDLALSGIVLGAAALTRSPALYSLAFVLVWLLLRAWMQRSTLQSSASEDHPVTKLKPLMNFATGWLKTGQPFLVIAACLAIVLPWTTRNYLTYNRLIPVDTLGQINLWLDLDKVSRRNQNIDTLRKLPQADRHLYALARAREILAEDPLRPFQATWLTFKHVWKAQYVEDFLVKQSFFTRPLRESAILGLAGDLVWLVFTVAGIAGLAGRPREGWHNRLFVLAWLGYSLFTILIFHVEPRYLIPIWTLIALYGAGVLAGRDRSLTPTTNPWRMIRSWSPYAIVQLVLVGAFLALFLSYRDYPAILARGWKREQAIITGERAYTAGNYPAAQQSFRAALDAHPDFVDAQVSLALALAADGRREEAAAVLERNSSRRTELVRGALARDTGDLPTATRLLTKIETTAGEDIQHWALQWLRPPATSSVAIGEGLDMGYIEGFSAGEYNDTGSFRWLEGTGRIVLPLPEPVRAGQVITIRATSGREQPAVLEIQVEGGPIQQIQIEAGRWHRYHLAVPPEAVGTRRLVVVLRAPTFVPALHNPESDDARALSLMIGSMSVR